MAEIASPLSNYFLYLVISYHFSQIITNGLTAPIFDSKKDMSVIQGAIHEAIIFLKCNKIQIDLLVRQVIDGKCNEFGKHMNIN